MRFPSRIWAIYSDHTGAAPADRGGARGSGAFALHGGAERLGDDLGVLGLQLRLDLGRDLEELAVAGLPDFQERARIEAAGDRAALVQALLELLAHQIFFEA